MKIKFVVLIFCIILATSNTYALTASIGNARMILNTDVVAGTPTILQKSIKVNNVNNISVDVTLVPSGAIKPFTKVLDSTFTIAPGDSKEARFVMTLDYGGRYDGKILVSFKPTDPSTKATPVGLASTVIVIAQGPPNPNPPAPENDTTSTPIGTVPQPSTNENATVPTQPTATQPSTTVPASTQPANPTTQTPQNNGQPVAPKANPLVGLSIILFVLVIGSIIFWWYMKR